MISGQGLFKTFNQSKVVTSETEKNTGGLPVFNNLNYTNDLA